MNETTVAGIVMGSGVSALVLTQLALRRRREQRDERTLAENEARGLHLPPSLHPVIDADRCIGSLACIKACPEGDILGVVDGAARLVHATHCVGHGRCAASCPVQAITLVFGTATRGVDLPEVDGRFESSRPGVHVVGELSGMGLIRNAVEQAAQCAGYLAEALGRPARDPAVADAVVVGAGPAGVSCALALRARGFSVRLLERGRLGGAMAHYPRHGLVMNGPLQLPGAARLKEALITKLQLLEYFEKALAAARVKVEQGVEVTGLSGKDGEFVVETGRGLIAARKVVLAAGRRGTPRTLGVPGEELAKVTYALVDAEQYAGKRVLVVGGGDAAVEAACAVAEKGAEGALSYRQAALQRCRPANRQRAEALAARGKLLLLMGTEVARIEEQAVVLRRGGQEQAVPNDFVIACLGGELPLDFLRRMGVQVRRLFGEQRGARPAGEREGPWTASPEERARRRWWRVLAVAGLAAAVLVVLLSLTGAGYYPLRGPERLRSPLHATLKPAGSLGITIGIAASAVMLTNFLYALRKRWSALSGLGNLSSWLDVHVFVGVMSPVVIAFHAAFQSNNVMASSTYASLGIVVATGLVGRWFYGLLPRAHGRQVELAELLGELTRTRARLEPLLAGGRDHAAVAALLEEAGAPPSRAPFALQLLGSLPAAVAFRARLAAALHLVPAEDRPALRRNLTQLRRLRAQAGLFGGIQRLMRVWRSLHVALAALLVVALTSHILLALYLGYGPGGR
ncbi:MAG: NAD(P)-binding domain-containing protein [Deltaproteobacteria bacterium]|nr:NAD(P)-binding domain-containing protein [Deltaproteobacteria bacterium]